MRTPRFKIKNQTEFPIFVKLTLEKSQSLEVENIQPGKRVSILWSLFSNFHLFQRAPFGDRSDQKQRNWGPRWKGLLPILTMCTCRGIGLSLTSAQSQPDLKKFYQVTEIIKTHHCWVTQLECFDSPEQVENISFLRQILQVPQDVGKTGGFWRQRLLDSPDARVPLGGRAERKRREADWREPSERKFLQRAFPQ